MGSSRAAHFWNKAVRAWNAGLGMFSGVTGGFLLRGFLKYGNACYLFGLYKSFDVRRDPQHDLRR